MPANFLLQAMMNDPRFGSIGRAAGYGNATPHFATLPGYAGVGNAMAQMDTRTTPGVPPASAAPPASLPQNWGRYLATVPQEDLDTNSEAAQQALQWVRQYDPNAQYTSGAAASGNAGSFLQYDMSKLPQNVTGGRGIQGIQNLGGLADAGRYAGPKLPSDPIYGNVGSSLFPIQDRGTWLDIVGPLIVGGAAGLGAGGFNMISSLMQKLPTVARMGSAMMSPQQLTPQQIALLQMLRGGR